MRRARWLVANSSSRLVNDKMWCVGSHQDNWDRKNIKNVQDWVVHCNANVDANAFSHFICPLANQPGG